MTNGFKYKNLRAQICTAHACLQFFLHRIGVNYNNVLRAAFTRTDTAKAQKKTDNLSIFFALLGYVSKKAAHRMLMKLTPYLRVRLDLAKVIITQLNIANSFTETIVVIDCKMKQINSQKIDLYLDSVI